MGRTGRAGVKGTAYTLVTEKDKEMVGHLVRQLETNGRTRSSSGSFEFSNEGKSVSPINSEFV